MEQRAYMIANTEKCLKEERKEQRIYISEMFDMIAGSETGAIIASSIAIKDANGK